MNAELDAAIRSIESRTGRRVVVTRHEARPILIGIGRALHSGRSGDAAAAGDRLAKLPPPLRESWEAAVRDEMEMAATEHVRSVDPRYLGHPRYDLDYTLEARRQLEHRRRACEHLGLPLDAALLGAVARADSLLEGHTGTRLGDWLAEGDEGAAS